MAASLSAWACPNFVAGGKHLLNGHAAAALIFVNSQAATTTESSTSGGDAPAVEASENDPNGGIAAGIGLPPIGGAVGGLLHALL